MLYILYNIITYC